MGTFDDNNMVSIDISGTVYKTSTTTLKAIPHSTLSLLDKKSPYYKAKKNAYYFDRDADMFKHVLDAHRTGELHMPRDWCAVAFRREMKFWKIPIRMLSPCCWNYAYDEASHMDTVKTIQEAWHLSSPLGRVHSTRKGRQSPATYRSRLWLFLDCPNSSTGAKIWLFVYLATVVLSSVIYLIWLQPDLRVNAYLSSTDLITKYQHEFHLNRSSTEKAMRAMFNEKIMLLGTTDPHPIMFGFDCVCMLVFAVELLLHFAASPDKLRFCYNRYHLLNVALVAAMVIALYLELNKQLFGDGTVGRFYLAMKSLTVFRLLLILRINKVYRGMKLLTVAVETSISSLRLLTVIFAIAAVIFGGLMFNAEIETKMFSNTFYAIWWAVVTMTTVGYGDLHPTRFWGYVVGSVCAITGIILISLPIAAVASNFGYLQARSSDLERHCKAVKNEESQPTVASDEISKVETICVNNKLEKDGM